MKIFIPEKAMSIEEIIPYLKEAIVNLALEMDKINRRIDGNMGTIPIIEEVDKSFYESLMKIDGIGKETADDIISIYPNMKSLVIDIRKGKKIPFRNDVVKLLEENYA